MTRKEMITKVDESINKIEAVFPVIGRGCLTEEGKIKYEALYSVRECLVFAETTEDIKKNAIESIEEYPERERAIKGYFRYTLGVLIG